MDAENDYEPKPVENLFTWTELNLNRYNWILTIKKHLYESLEPSDARLELLADEESKLKKLYGYFAERCSIPCGSLCCHFPGDATHVAVNRDEAIHLRRALRGGKNEKYADYLPLEKVDDLLRENIRGRDDMTYRLDGKDHAYVVKTRRGVMHPNRAMHVPNNPSETFTLWTDPSCRPCAFLDENHMCSLHEKNVHLETCASFICNLFVIDKTASWLALNFNPESHSIQRLNRIYARLGKSMREGGFLAREKRLDDQFRSLALGQSCRSANPEKWLSDMRKQRTIIREKLKNRLSIG